MFLTFRYICSRNSLKINTIYTELCHASLCCYEISTHQFDRKKVSCIQGVTGRFVLFCSKNQNPGQSCHPSIDLTMVIKQKSDKDFKNVGTKRGDPSYNS